MTDETSPHRFEVAPTAESHFSWLRTRMSLERTLMSWVRTATALIGFGFTIVQFFDRLHDMEGVAPAVRPQTPRYLGLSLILSGILALVVSAWQYHAIVRYLRDGEFSVLAGVEAMHPKKTPIMAVTISLILIGLFAFGAVFTRLQ